MSVGLELYATYGISQCSFKNEKSESATNLIRVEVNPDNQNLVSVVLDFSPSPRRFDHHFTFETKSLSIRLVRLSVDPRALSWVRP